MKILLILLMFALVACSGIRPRYHEVSDGETLSGIANRYDVPLVDLRSRNSDSLANGLQPGSKLYIPFEESPKWDQEETESVAREPGSESASYELDRAKFSWPVSGRISSYFGVRRYLGGSRSRRHQGLDIAAPKGTPVRASRSGHVIYSGTRIRGYGTMIILRHAGSFSTIYSHLSKIHVKKGQFVSRGQLIGRVGRTGRATNHHLHFEVRNGTKPVNPLEFLQRQYARNS